MSNVLPEQAAMVNERWKKISSPGDDKLLRAAYIMGGPDLVFAFKLVAVSKYTMGYTDATNEYTAMLDEVLEDK